ncbi:MAG TPA: PilZ domain-containing protein [Candidatus Krumholzibacteria bacterium]|nr:PilZ domain-containing protein [Candidatus Krumholzibacteria bacterium]HPD71028.1 PilZ domain-containing protein [Candidatus Krumholzibacteria bacterium]HRY39272.1 PilZ domain-containing protein [Candidatus Krumholzibacteria bacterium]
MIRETLTAIALAGQQALQRLSPRLAVKTQVTQVREWSFAMPNLGRVTVANSPIHQVYVGLSQPLARQVGRILGPLPAGQEALLEEFKQALVARVPANRPIGAWDILPPEGDVRVLRGVRSFILRQQTAAGNLYLMADVASRGEFESLRRGAWEEELAAHLLPPDIGRIDCVDEPAALQRLASFLVRLEHDLELLIPGADGNVYSCNGVLLRLVKQDQRYRMVLSLDLDKDLRRALGAGQELEGSFGAAGRVFRFRTTCAGTEGLNLDAAGELPCHLFELPARFHLDQRRRYFRIRPQQPLSVRYLPLPAEAAGDPGAPPETPAVEIPAEPPAEALEATVEDLSFSGAGLVFAGEPPRELQRGGLVGLWLAGNDLSQPLQLTGIVRRLATSPRGRGRCVTNLGIEFLVRTLRDRQSTQGIRQYVMTQQRLLLSRRGSETQLTLG